MFAPLCNPYYLLVTFLNRSINNKTILNDQNGFTPPVYNIIYKYGNHVHDHTSLLIKDIDIETLKRHLVPKLFNKSSILENTAEPEFQNVFWVLVECGKVLAEVAQFAASVADFRASVTLWSVSD
jgi:hypothetical protein